MGATSGAFHNMKLNKKKLFHKNEFKKRHKIKELPSKQIVISKEKTSTSIFVNSGNKHSNPVSK